MTFRINTKNYQLHPDTKSYIQYKLEKISKIVHPIGIHVHITRNTHHRKGDIFDIDIDVHIPKKILNAHEKGVTDIRVALDLVSLKLKKQIVKYRGKNLNARFYASSRDPSRRLKALFQGIRRA